MKKSIKIVLVMLMIFAIILVSTSVFAVEFRPEQVVGPELEVNEFDSVNSIENNILGIVRVLGSIVVVGMLMILGT